MRAAGPPRGRVSRSDVPRGAILSISSKIGCAPQTLNDWVKKAEVDRGDRTGITTEMAEKSEPCPPLVRGQWTSAYFAQAELDRRSKT